MPNRLAGDPGFYRALDEARAKQERLGEMAGSTSFTAGTAQIGSSQLMDKTGTGRGEFAKMRNEDPQVAAALSDWVQRLAGFNSGFPFPGEMRGPVA